MKAGETLSATARMERSREATKRAAARELLYCGILARLWPSFVAEVDNPVYPWIVCVQSPAGELTWRLTEEERPFFDWMETGATSLKRAIDRTPTLMALAGNGW